MRFCQTTAWDGTVTRRGQGKTHFIFFNIGYAFAEMRQWKEKINENK